MTKVYLASDHAGFELKEALIPFLLERGFAVEDLGPKTLEPADDYPDYMMTLARTVVENIGSRGIGIGGSGQGEGMALNRVKGVRAMVFYGGNKEVLETSRKHHDDNILALGAWHLSPEDAKAAVLTWLQTPFSGEERHVRRIAKLDSM